MFGRFKHAAYLRNGSGYRFTGTAAAAAVAAAAAALRTGGHLYAHALN